MGTKKSKSKNKSKKYGKNTKLSITLSNGEDNIFFTFVLVVGYN